MAWVVMPSTKMLLHSDNRGAVLHAVTVMDASRGGWERWQVG